MCASRAERAGSRLQALDLRKEAEWVEVLMELAEAERGGLWQLTARFDVATTPEELITTTRQAIVDVADFDERQINRDRGHDRQRKPRPAALAQQSSSTNEDLATPAAQPSTGG